MWPALRITRHIVEHGRCWHTFWGLAQTGENMFADCQICETWILLFKITVTRRYADDSSGIIQRIPHSRLSKRPWTSCCQLKSPTPTLAMVLSVYSCAYVVLCSIESSQINCVTNKSM